MSWQALGGQSCRLGGLQGLCRRGDAPNRLQSTYNFPAGPEVGGPHLCDEKVKSPIVRESELLGNISYW